MVAAAASCERAVAQQQVAAGVTAVTHSSCSHSSKEQIAVIFNVLPPAATICLISAAAPCSSHTHPKKISIQVLKPE